MKSQEEDEKDNSVYNTYENIAGYIILVLNGLFFLYVSY